MKFAFAGFRHNHIFSLHNMVKDRNDLQIVACCEEDAPTRKTIADAGRVTITHDNCGQMLAETNVDVVAVGDYYARHGQTVIAALRAGKHVIADKPLCISLEELNEIESLATKKKLSVQCMFDLRGLAPYITLKKLIDDDVIGKVHTIMFQGLHPLLRNTRPAWYFEAGKHGGTINDIAVHGIDLALWLTGQPDAEIIAAREWNAAIADVPHFHDAAQLMFCMGNGCGVIGDVSYLAPTKCGFSGEQYWRVCCHGSNGMAETHCTAANVKVATHADEKSREIPLLAPNKSVYLDSLLIEAGFSQGHPQITTQQVLRASRIALNAQHMANKLSQQ